MFVPDVLNFTYRPKLTGCSDPIIPLYPGTNLLFNDKSVSGTFTAPLRRDILLHNIEIPLNVFAPSDLSDVVGDILLDITKDDGTSLKKQSIQAKTLSLYKGSVVINFSEPVHIAAGKHIICKVTYTGATNGTTVTPSLSFASWTLDFSLTQVPPIPTTGLIFTTIYTLK